MAKKAKVRVRPKGSPPPSEVQVESGYLTSLVELAKYFGISYHTVASAWRAAGMPIEDDGRYCIATITAWREMRNANKLINKRALRTANNPAVSNLDDDPVHQRRLTDLEIKKAELEKRRRENEKAAGDYISRHDVQMFFADLLSRLRDDLARVPAEMAGSYPEDLRAELEDQLKCRLDLCLETLYRQRNKIGDIEKT